MPHFEKCPTCGGPCDVTWRGLDLVSETGDETLASKTYASINTELLEALEIIARFTKDGEIIDGAEFDLSADAAVDDLHYAIDSARAAIAKAKGESP